jgi:hypothetical protein
MEGKDLKQIEAMMAGVLSRFRDEIGEEFKTFKREIGDDFRHQLAIQREDFQHKLDLVVEGQQALVEKLESTRAELKSEIAKVDQGVISFAADLSEHRRDTEAHRKGWRVREE